MKRTITIICGLALALGACGKKQEPSSDVGSAGSATAVATAADADAAGGPGSASDAAASEPAAATEVDVPTEMDFEDDASAQITDKNLEAELRALETELAQ